MRIVDPNEASFIVTYHGRSVNTVFAGINRNYIFREEGTGRVFDSASEGLPPSEEVLAGGGSGLFRIVATHGTFMKEGRRYQLVVYTDDTYRFVRHREIIYATANNEHNEPYSINTNEFTTDINGDTNEYIIVE